MTASPFALYLAIASASVGAPPEFEALRLPAAVSVEGTGYNNGESLPFERLKAKIGETWTAGTQELWQGDLGFVPRTIVHGDESTSLRVELSRSTGVKDDWFKVARVSIIDPLVSPIAWTRLAEVAAEQGVLKSQLSPGRIEVSFDISRESFGTQCVDIYWDAASDVLQVKAGRTRKDRAEYTYTSWKTLDGGVRHPTDIAILYPGEPEPFRKHVIIDVLELHPPAAPSVPKFANTMRILETSTGRTLDGELRPVSDASGPVPASATAGRPVVVGSASKGFSWPRAIGAAAAVCAVFFGAMGVRRAVSRSKLSG